MTSDVTVVIDGGGCLEMFFEPLSNCSRGFTNVFLITLHPATLVSVDDSTFLLDGILVFGSHWEVFDCVTSLKVHLHSIFTACFLHTLTDPLVVGDHYVRPLDVIASIIVPFFVLLAAVLVFILALFIAHTGYMHFVNASSRCFSSSFNSSVLEQMVLALCCSEPTTLYLDETVWLLSH